MIYKNARLRARKGIGKQGIKNGIWIKGFFLLSIGLLFLGCATSPGLPSRPVAESSLVGPLNPFVVEPVESKEPMLVSPPSLVVNPDRLWQTLQAILALDDRFSGEGRAQMRSFLVEQLTALEWVVTRQAFVDEEGLAAENIIATKTWSNGSNLNESSLNKSKLPPKRWIVGAHYDTIWPTPGADDNATGVAALLELAHLFGAASLDSPEPVSLELVFFDLEERGLLGSFAYTQRPENLEHLQGAIVLEMLGYTCPEPGCQRYPKDLLIDPPSDRGDFLAVVGDAEHPEMLTAFTLEAQTQFQNLSQDPSQNPSTLNIFTLNVPLKGVLTPDVLRSDHAPFWLKNIGAVMVTDTAYLRNPHYHQTTDTLDTLDRTFFTQVSQAVVNAVLYYLGV